MFCFIDELKIDVEVLVEKSVDTKKWIFMFVLWAELCSQNERTKFDYIYHLKVDKNYVFSQNRLYRF